MLFDLNFQGYELVVQNKKKILKLLHHNIGLSIHYFEHAITEKQNKKFLDFYISSPCPDDDWSPSYSAYLNKKEVLSLIQELQTLADNMEDSEFEEFGLLKSSLENHGEEDNSEDEISKEE